MEEWGSCCCCCRMDKPFSTSERKMGMDGKGTGWKKGKQRHTLHWNKVPNQRLKCFGEWESPSLLSLLLPFSHFPHSSPPPSLFFGDYCTMHLPVETAATRCYDPNTTAWCDDWLRAGAGVGVGGVVQHTSSTTFTIQTKKEKWTRPFTEFASPVTHLLLHHPSMGFFPTLCISSGPCSLHLHSSYFSAPTSIKRTE